MTIIYISNARIPSEKAHPYQILRTCEAFGMQDVDTILLHPFRVNTQKMKQVEDIYEYYGLDRNFSIKTLPSLDLPILEKISPKFWFYIRTFSYSLLAILYILFAKTKKREFVIYSRDKFTTLLLLSVKHLLNLQIFYEAHKGLGRLGEMFKSLYQRLDGVVVVNKQLMKKYSQFGIEKNRISIAYNGVDLENFQINVSNTEVRNKLRLPKDKKIIVYTGHLYPWKGVHTLVKSACYLDEDILIVLVGGRKGDIRDLKDYIEKEGIQRILLTGYVSPDKVPLYQKAADILVLPNSSSNETWATYTCPIKMFEYMASGKPIVATSLPPIKEVLEDGRNAKLVPPEDSKRLASAISEILKNPKKGDKLGMTAQYDVQQFSWNQRSEKIIHLIEVHKNNF